MLSGIIGINYCKRHNIKFCLQSEGGFIGTGKGFKENFKKKLFSSASLYLTGMKPDNDYFAYYGAPISKIVQFPFASMHDFEAISMNNLEYLKKTNKEKLSLCGYKVFICWKNT